MPLNVRLRRHCIHSDAATLAGIVGLKSHPQYELARTQMRGYSGMVTFYIKGGMDEARKFLSSLKVISLFIQLLHIFRVHSCLRCY